MDQQTQGNQQDRGDAPGQGAPDSGAPDRTRRSFLKAAPLGALAVVTGGTQAAETPAAAPAAQPGVKRGYHETEHIRRYYETAAYW